MVVAWTRRILLIPVLALTASVSLAAETSFDKRFDAPPGGHLMLDTETGAVTVVGHDAQEVIVHAEMSGSDIDRFKITAEQNASGVTVTGRVRPRIWFGWSSMRVRITIDVPRNYAVELATSGGGINVRNLNASVRGKTSGGGIVVQDVTGSIDMRTSGGEVEAARLNGPAQFRSSGGNIQVGDATGDLDVQTSGGGIHLTNIDGKVTADTSGGSIHAEVRGNRGISLTTSGGGITLLLPEDTRASVDAETSGGSARSELPLTTTETFDRNRLRGSINGGGESVFLRTSGGDIRIASLR